MIRLNTILLALFLSASAMAQDWAKKEFQAVFTLKTFSSDGSLIGSSTGFFIDSQGTAISGFSPFKGASNATIIDSQSNEYQVECILGANDDYDLAKFKVDSKKTIPLPPADQSPSEGDQLWLMTYSVKKAPKCQETTVKNVQKVTKGFDYFTISLPADETIYNCPLLNSQGQVVAMIQQGGSPSDSLGYAVSTDFAASLSVSGLSLNDPTLKTTNLPIAIPDDPQQAILMLYIAASGLDSLQFDKLIERFIIKHPNIVDGYVYKAQIATTDGRFEDADTQMNLAVKNTDNKDEAHFSYAKLIYQQLLLQTPNIHTSWTFDKAVQETEAAININPLLPYKQLKAEILFSDKKFQDALDVYMQEINNGNRQADLWFAAARCQEELGDTAACIQLLDSAIASFSKPWLKDVAPYLLARAQVYLKTGKNRLAIIDLSDYETLMSSQLNDNFYYIRFQAALSAKLYQQALNDIKTAISKAPDNLIYYSEKASLEVRVALYDEAITTANELIMLDPQASDGYLFLGLAQCLKGDKTEGTANLTKAAQMGETQANELIEKYGK